MQGTVNEYIDMIRARRLQWLGQLERMTEERTVKLHTQDWSIKKIKNHEKDGGIYSA